MNGTRWVYGSIIGYFVAALFNSILVVIKETYGGVHDWLATTFTHHWLGQGILVILVFLIFTFIGANIIRDTELNESKANIYIALAVVATFLSIVIIGGFFLIHFAS